MHTCLRSLGPKWRLGQTLYHRRKRDANCIVGKIAKVEEKFVKNCACMEDDFEWYASLTVGTRHIDLSPIPTQ